MRQHLAHIAIVVDDYDRAIDFYTQKLNFQLTEDTKLSDTKRWVIVTPPGAKECSLLLAKGANEHQCSRIGDQTGGRVFLFLHTDNFEKSYQNLIVQQIKIVRQPSHETYGTVAVFEDLYGNLWDLIEPIKHTKPLFHSTGILRVKSESNLTHLKSELKKLAEQTRLEEGNLLFDIHLSLGDPSKIIIWESFRDEEAFQKHLGSKHLQEFLKLGLVDFEVGYATEKIA